MKGEKITDGEPFFSFLYIAQFFISINGLKLMLPKGHAKWYPRVWPSGQ